MLHRLCTEGCAAKADVQMACNWVCNVVLEAPVQPSAAGAAAAGCTAAADSGDAAVVHTLIGLALTPPNHAG